MPEDFVEIVNIDSGNGLVPSDLCCHMALLGHNVLIWSILPKQHDAVQGLTHPTNQGKENCQSGKWILAKFSSKS